MSVSRVEVDKAVESARLRHGIVGNDGALTSALSRAVRVAPIDVSVLVTGESGTGKEFFPQIIHENSPRKHNRYIAVNCGAIPEGTIDSELFGHEKGAFTGAVATRKGWFEEADGGTIFLDEVAELPLSTQARLLRVLENGEFIKVGSSVVQKCNVRIVAATNADMPQAVAQGKFREDLFYRLATVSIWVPPLRERGGDAGLLAMKFATDFADKYSTSEVRLQDDAKTELNRQRWPGNVRQLKNVIEQVSLFEAGHDVNAEVLRSYLPEPPVTLPAPVSVTATDRLHTYTAEREALFATIMALRREIEELKARVVDLEHPSSQIQAGPIDLEPPMLSLQSHESAKSLQENEKEMIAKALERNDGRRKAAADELSISERTLYRKIKEYGLEG